VRFLAEVGGMFYSAKNRRGIRWGSRCTYIMWRVIRVAVVL